MCPTSQHTVVQIERTNIFPFVPFKMNNCMRRQANTATVFSKTISYSQAFTLFRITCRNLYFTPKITH